MASPDTSQQKPERVIQLQSAYYQLKTCNALTIVFAICGFLVFAHIYESRIASDFIAAMKDMTTLILIVSAFLPALFLSLLSRRYEKRYMALLKQE